MTRNRTIKGYRVFVNKKDGRGHVPVEKTFRSPVTAQNEVNRLINGKNAGLYSKPLAIPVYA
jgi:hypothetical protein